MKKYFLIGILFFIPSIAFGSYVSISGDTTVSDMPSIAWEDTANTPGDLSVYLFKNGVSLKDTNTNYHADADSPKDWDNAYWNGGFIADLGDLVAGDDYVAVAVMNEYYANRNTKCGYGNTIADCEYDIENNGISGIFLASDTYTITGGGGSSTSTITSSSTEMLNEYIGYGFDMSIIAGIALFVIKFIS